jgi:hypothetical protein
MELSFSARPSDAGSSGRRSCHSLNAGEASTETERPAVGNNPKATFTDP